MIDGTNSKPPGTSVRLLDPVERLIAAWERWEHAAAHPPRYLTGLWLDSEAREKESALRALGLDSNHAHKAIAECRRRHVAGQPGGMSIPDAVQTYVNDTFRKAG